MTTIIDYDAGNIKSVEKALNFLGEKTLISSDPDVIRKAERIILPGVGAFGDCMEKLDNRGLIPVIKEVCKSTPFLGICLGLQLLFPSSEETPGAKGLGVLDGTITRIPDKDGIKVPQIGWNSITYPNESRLFKGIEEGSFVYFVHSYYLTAADSGIVSARTNYSVDIDAAIEKDNVFACQFHPEKSGEVGLKVLSNFLKV